MALEGKVVVVTGASSGIGRRTAVELARAGAIVCVAARRADRLETLSAELAGAGHSMCVTDVSRRADVKALAAHVAETHGRCDALVNNAGRSGGPYDEKTGVGDLKDVMATNFFSAAHCVAEFLPLLKASAPSAVVNVASVAGRLAIGSSSYSASKHALVGWSECLDVELAPLGVRVSLVEPGLIPTEGFPQRMFVESRVLRYALGSEEAVARTIIATIERPKVQRMTPRWYYLLQVPRLVSPPFFRWVQRKYGVTRRS
ncbi:MAG TPA: SDR family oxidoreductase [Actinomycetota bacterium]|nr:SDR family oxidoreductase [Actinomycetota bacterium]